MFAPPPAILEGSQKQQQTKRLIWLRDSCIQSHSPKLRAGERADEFFPRIEYFGAAARMKSGICAHDTRISCGLRDAISRNPRGLIVRDLKPEGTEVTIAYRPRPQFLPLHSRAERFACIVTHRRAGKTVACIHDLHRAAVTCARSYTLSSGWFDRQRRHCSSCA